MTSTLFALTLLAAASAAPALNLTELRMPGRVIWAAPADVDGDGASDLLVFWREGFPPQSRGRVSVYRTEAGRVSTQPAQVLLLPPSTVACDVGDINEDGRADVLLLRADGVWVLTADAAGRYGTEPTPLVNAMTVAAFPNEDHVPPAPLLIELAPGRQGLVVPTIPIGPLALYEADASRSWHLRQVLRVPARANLFTAAEDQRFTRDYGAMFQLVYPRWVAADQNADGRRDLFFTTEDVVAIFRAREDGGFPATPDLVRNFALLKPEERVRAGVLARAEIGDVNGDGRADLMLYKTSGGISNMQSEIRLYLATPANDYPTAPDFSLQRSGYGASATLTDVDGDGRADLVRPQVEMGLTNLIGMMLAGKLEVTFEVYLSREGKLRPDPDLRIPSSLGINFRSNQELTGPYPIFRQDFTGDGIGDLVIGRARAGAGRDPDRLEIRPGEGGGKFAADPVWQINLPGTRYVSIFRARAADRAGLLVYFSQVEEREGDVWVLTPGS
jgi:hypothetical protein